MLVQFPQTAGPLNGLADALLRGPSSLSPAERETIATFVSSRNECTFCTETHGAVARHLHGQGAGVTDVHKNAVDDVHKNNTAGAGNVHKSNAGVADNVHKTSAGVVDDVIKNGAAADVGPKLQALLTIAEKVRVDGRSVSTADVEQARAAGADDKAIHDTVLISAAFCMFNRYVDGLATLTPDNPESYARHAKALAEGGYLQPPHNPPK